MEGLKSILLIPSANYLLFPNDVIRRYVRSIHLEYRQLFIEGVGTIQYFLRILKTSPYCIQRSKYTSNPEITKLLTLSLYRTKDCLSFGTKYVRVKINVLTKYPTFS